MTDTPRDPLAARMDALATELEGGLVSRSEAADIIRRTLDAARPTDDAEPDDHADDDLDRLLAATRPTDDAALRQLLSEAIEELHQYGLVSDHHDPSDLTGWNVHGIETCGYRLCVESRAALAAPAPLVLPRLLEVSVVEKPPHPTWTMKRVDQ